jgi:dTDP-4-dehydrorhamnose 3,5-epimerase
MTAETCSLQGVLLLKPSVFRDSRGYFKELSRRDAYAQLGVDTDFVQVNSSVSAPGVLRGLHYQKKFVQAKLVAVCSGSIWDVVVDCRPRSPTFGRWEAFTLTADGGEEIFVPEGFAHGFAVLGDKPAAIVYQCTDYYHPGDEGGVNWASPSLGIDWPVGNPILSDKDKALPAFSTALEFPEPKTER